MTDSPTAHVSTETTIVSGVERTAYAMEADTETRTATAAFTSLIVKRRSRVRDLPMGYWQVIVPKLSDEALRGDEVALRRDVESTPGNRWSLRAHYARPYLPNPPGYRGRPVEDQSRPQRWVLSAVVRKGIHSRHFKETVPVEWDNDISMRIVATGETLGEAAYALQQALIRFVEYTRAPEAHDQAAAEADAPAEGAST